jgi:hypothetical protein
MGEAPFEPRARHLGYLLGSAAWVLALVVLAMVLDQTDAVAVALAIVAFSILVGAAMSTLMRRGRVRDERRL